MKNSLFSNKNRFSCDFKSIIPYIFISFVSCLTFSSIAQAQDSKVKTASFELEEEQLTIEADIPSVDLIISFRELQERNQGLKESFLQEIIDSAKDEPF